MKQLSFTKKRRRTPGVKLGRPASTHCGARKARDNFAARHPLHITLRLREGLPNLRTRQGARVVRHAICGAHRRGVRVVHFAILSNHIHMIVEGKNQSTLFGAMKSFCIRLSLALRKLAEPLAVKSLDERGLGLFRGRYHVQILKTPRQVKNALQYVLLNPSKHKKCGAYMDPWTTAVLFQGWAELLRQPLRSLRPMKNAQARALKEKLKAFVAEPSLWLLRVGWMKAV